MDGTTTPPQQLIRDNAEALNKLKQEELLDKLGQVQHDSFEKMKNTNKALAEFKLLPGEKSVAAEEINKRNHWI